MIQWTEISHFEDRFTLFNRQNGIYIVPDIKTKLKLQNQLLKRQHLISTEQILRAQDFYNTLFLSTFPDYTVISSSQLDFLFQTWIKKDSWIPHTSVLHYFQSFLPFLTHPEGTNLFQQWIQKDSSRRKYQQAYEQTQIFWEELKKQNMMEKTCSKYMLAVQELKTWSFSLTVDLSFSLDYTELEIYSNLGKAHDVHFLIPAHFEHPIFAQSHAVYSELKTRYPQKTTSPLYKKRKNQKYTKQVQKFPNPIEEVQFVTEQLRKGLESGRKPEQCAILAPNIETYWPCLNIYFKKEGIPIQKESSISYISFPQIQKWLSSIRLHFGNISYQNLEDALSSSNDNQCWPGPLRSQYYHCDRSKDIQHLPLQIISKPELSLNEFLEIILNLWKPIIKQFPNPEIDSYLNNMLAEISQSLHSLSHFKAQKTAWLEMLEKELSEKEKTQNHDFHGVQCFSLNAITSLNAEQIHIIGLDHHSCQKFYPNIFNEQDSQKILNDLGFYCRHLDPHQNEYELIHLIKTFQGTLTLSYSQSSWSQEITQASRLWQLEYSPNRTFQKPQTVWNSIKQLSSTEDILQHTMTSHSKKDIQNALNFENSDTVPYKNSLSPSSIHKYIKCPFIFLSEEIFHLKQKTPKDMDWNPLNKGFILHQFFENIIDKKLTLKEDILKQIESLFSCFEVMDDDILEFYSQELLHKSSQFLKHEQDNRTILPEIKTLGVEISFKGFWNLKKQKLDSNGDIMIKGKIDRVDKYKNQILIIDYKSAKTKVISSWKTNLLDSQMPLYIQAVEAGLLEGLEIDNKSIVSAALYLSYKDFTYKGFISKNSDWVKLLKRKTLSVIDEDKKNKILSEINQHLQKKLENIQKGIFIPKPVQVSECTQCQWNKICRTVHLN